MGWFLFLTLFLIALTLVYGAYSQPAKKTEGYVDYTETHAFTADGLASGEAADFRQGLPLADMLVPATGLTNLGAAGCAAADSARQAELGGQYVQRTNNYRREYPDHCSSLFSDFVGAFYKPKEGGVGLTVPCNGDC